MPTPTPEDLRLQQDSLRQHNWKRWGPYLSERQWATVREDYSPDGDVWRYFPHDHARSRAYRWGEDGLLGITDRECRLCFSLALWNHHDPILKERLFGLTGIEGNHGEDVKENYYYLDSTPTHSYMKALYKYPQAEFPYARLVEENRRRSRTHPEFELADTGIFNDSRYFDIFAEYAKANTDDIFIRITIHNRGPAPAPITLLPTLWFRNTWSWGAKHEETTSRPTLFQRCPGIMEAQHSTLGTMYLAAESVGPSTNKKSAPTAPPQLLFTENNTNFEALYQHPNESPFTKDAFHRALIQGDTAATNPAQQGTKAAFLYRLNIPPGKSTTIRLRLTNDPLVLPTPFIDCDTTFTDRLAEADAFYDHRLPCKSVEPRNVARQAYAGLLWSKQFYHYIVHDWRKGDPGQVAPPKGHADSRNSDWPHLYSRDVISMPDKWEYPWFAAWDLAFHMVALAKVDGTFAKNQLELFLREWYMHPNGQIPAYEFAFSDVNPPVHAWAVWRVYKMTAPKGQRDLAFLERAFHKLMLNFTWWVNRKDVAGRHLFAGGFLGLDNIGMFDRSKPLPGGNGAGGGGRLEQADGTAWMAFYCSTMLAIAVELATHNPAYEDIASKFFEHFVAIVDAVNTLGGTGLWDDQDGFYYDHLRTEARQNIPLRVRSLVGLVPLFAAEIFEKETFDKLPGFTKRLKWFLENRKDLARNIAYMESDRDRYGQHDGRHHSHFLLAIPSRQRLERVLKYLFDESEFLSPHGIRSVSKIHKDHPFTLHLNGESFSVNYVPGESDSSLFGGNSNWRGPIWMPMNFLLIEALERYYHFYGDDLKISVPNSPTPVTLDQAIKELRRRLGALFLPAANNHRRPCHGDTPEYQSDPHWRDLLLFHEYFHADTGQGLGANHQTGWTALCVHFMNDPTPPQKFPQPKSTSSETRP